MPDQIVLGKGSFKLTSDFTVYHDQKSEKLTHYVRRFLFRLDGKAPVYFGKDISDKASSQFKIEYEQTADAKLGMDESYPI